MSFGYTMNRMGLGILLNDRARASWTPPTARSAIAPNAGGAWTV